MKFIKNFLRDKAQGKSTSGFTLVELIIVLAIVAIIGAILIPNFLSTTDRARFRSDIQSARVLQNALELHNIEQPIPIAPGTSIETVLTTLNQRGYVDARRVAVQTHGAVFMLDSDGNILLNISGAAVSENVRTTLYSQLSRQERYYVFGGQSSQGG